MSLEVLQEYAEYLYALDDDEIDVQEDINDLMAFISSKQIELHNRGIQYKDLPVDHICGNHLRIRTAKSYYFEKRGVVAKIIPQELKDEYNEIKDTEEFKKEYEDYVIMQKIRINYMAFNFKSKKDLIIDNAKMALLLKQNGIEYKYEVPDVRSHYFEHFRKYYGKPKSELVLLFARFSKMPLIYQLYKEAKPDERNGYIKYFEDFCKLSKEDQQRIRIELNDRSNQKRSADSSEEDI